MYFDILFLGYEQPR